MKKQWIHFIGVAIILLVLAACTGCTSTAASPQDAPATVAGSSSTKTITDGFGRTVTVPADPARIVCSGSGCLRYVVYLGAQDRVVGVDSQEKKVQPREGRAYAVTNPQFSDLPLIGEMRGKDDPEKIIGIGPQIIFKTGSSGTTYGTSGPEADTLQAKTGIPVIAFPYGSLRTPAERAEFTAALRLMGKTLGKDARAGELIAYVDEVTADLERRTMDIPADQQKTVYIGGVSSAGAHGIISTEPAYPPFLWVHAKNIAAGSDTQHADISKEIIVEGDPEFLFIDVGTIQMDNDGAIGELKSNPAYAGLAAVKNGKVYGVLPYNFYSVNYETVLADAYFIGKILYPDRFFDIDPQMKADEISIKFVGKPAFGEINKNYRNLGFTQIATTD
ncbi:MAG: iron ABC transporter substrate-binding protein [Methanomicrobiales archaeon HGW-Methanomicrobiales-3]|jgi:iron complex transport system substrate-binding protein|nr:MAG: iron ABC transporter substrate-binding protein [Methanomicrobiales archaeon HGW-Methanomicrobiales-3]